MPSAPQILVDSDAFVGRMSPDDAHHHQAKGIFQRLEEGRVPLVTTSFVVAETATVLSYRQGQTLARSFLDLIEKSKLPVAYITEELYREALQIFKQQTKKGTSVTDCANIAVVRRLNIPTIFSFDQVYPKKFGLPLAGS